MQHVFKRIEIDTMTLQDLDVTKKKKGLNGDFKSVSILFFFPVIMVECLYNNKPVNKWVGIYKTGFLEPHTLND